MIESVFHGLHLVKLSCCLALRSNVRVTGDLRQERAQHAVLVAVELALEAAPPSGRVSVEHVQNVLARLNAASRPANVVTALAATTPPQANTARYDRLRRREAEEADHA